MIKSKKGFIFAIVLLIAPIVVMISCILSAVFCGYTNNMQSKKYKITANENAFIAIIEQLDKESKDSCYIGGDYHTNFSIESEEGDIRIDISSSSGSYNLRFWNDDDRIEGYISSDTFHGDITIYSGSYSLKSYSPNSIRKSLAEDYVSAVMSTCKSAFNSYCINKNISTNNGVVTFDKMIADNIKYTDHLEKALVKNIVFSSISGLLGLFFVVSLFISVKNIKN